MAKDRRRNLNEAEQGRQDFLARLREKGIELPEEEVSFLEEHGNLSAVINDDDEEIEISINFNPSLNSITKKEANADLSIRILSPVVKRDSKVVVMPKSVYEEDIRTSTIFYGSVSEIHKSDWMPESIERHSPEFRAWINSVNAEDGFWNSIHYYKFSLYVQQAQQWEREFQKEGEDNLTYRYRECTRMAQNSLFALNRYLELKEASKTGMKKYVATKAHQILLYIFDCGYSPDIAKARQIAFTTTICGWALVKAMCNPDVQVKYISENESKAKRTFLDKVKYPFGKFPKWSRPAVGNDPQDFIFFGEKDEKGVIEGNNSVIEVLAPTKTAVASSSPTVTLVDEAGQIPILQDIVSDVEPTMEGYNPKTGQQEIMRQLGIWGTGGYMTGAAGVAFKSVFMSHYEAWHEKADTVFVPLIFNVWYRPGWNKEKQEKKRKIAYAVSGPEKEKARTRFHQSYPETLDDIFKMSGNTLLPEEWIQSRINLIRERGVEDAVAQYGYFEPIYDFNERAHEGSDVPYKITGAVFVRCEKSDSRCSTVILDDRRPWKNRYYKGTDPIASHSGLSDMSSTIWDAHWSMPVALMVFRSQDYRQAFLQSTLLGMYYDVEGKGAVPDLTEANIGAAFVEYVTNKGIESSIVLESELPELFQTSKQSARQGIDNRGNRTRNIITELKNIYLTYGNRIFIKEYFVQLKTFVEKPSGKGTTWEPQDKKINRDDALFSLVFAYICAMCFAHKRPVEIDLRPEASVGYVMKQRRKPNGELELVRVKKKKQQVRKELSPHVR